MKKYSYLLFLSLCTLGIFIIISVYTMVNVFNGLINISTFISPTLTIFNILFTTYLSKKTKKSVLTKYQYDNYFTDRTNEFISIEEFITKSEDPVCYVIGKTGIGKSTLLKEAADRINDNKYHFKAKALYLSLDKNKHIDNIVSNILGLSLPINAMDVCKKLLEESDFPWVIMIDHVDDVSWLSAKDFAYSIFNYGKVKTIISYDGHLERTGIEPTTFNNDIIKELSVKYGLNLSQKDIYKIQHMSQGLPVYIRFLLNQYKSCGDININDNIDIRAYIKVLIENKIEESQKDLLSLICCIKEVGIIDVSVKELLHIGRNFSHEDILILEKISFITLFNNRISMDDDISHICTQILSKYKNRNYEIIYDYYMHIKSHHDYALIALLLSSKTIDNIQWIYSVLERKKEIGDFPYIVRIGQLDKNCIINYNIFEQSELYQYIQIEYFKSLLEQGLYNEAQDVIQTYDFYKNGRKGIMEISSESEFYIHYAIADLYHLTNRFEDAIDYCDMLEQKCQSTKNGIDLYYLKAHCLRHIARDLEQSFYIFKAITDSKENFQNSPKTYIRAAYSIVSIQMLWGLKAEEFIFQFSDIYELASQTKFKNSVDAYITRHYCMYLACYQKNIDTALSISKETLNSLESTNSRIKYDFYFEIAEYYRLIFEETMGNDAKKQSLYYYSKALTFASDSHDYNLQSSAELGQILVQLKDGFENISHEKILHTINQIINTTKQLDLLLNYHYAIVIKHILLNVSLDEKYIELLETMRFNNLHDVAKAFNAGNNYSLKLIVM